MVTIKIIALVYCLAVIAYSKACADILEERGQKFNTWRNKWKSVNTVFGVVHSYKHWWYLGLHTPEFQEKFPFSSTLLVSFTDEWHRFNSLRHIHIALAVGVFTNSPLLVALVVLGLHSFFFHVTYYFLKRK